MIIKICLAQPYVKPCNLAENFQKIISYAEQAYKNGANMLFLPSDALTGKDLGTLENQTDFRRDAANYRIRLQQLIKNRLQIIFTDNYDFCGYQIQPKSVGISTLGKIIKVSSGSSAILNNRGHAVVRAKAFAEDFLTVELETLDGNIKMAPPPAPLPEGSDFIYKQLYFGTKEFFNIIGIKKIVLGLSGGIDSAVAAALYCQILGAKNVITVNMPSEYNSATTKEVAKNIAHNLDCQYLVIPISKSVQELQKVLTTNNLNNSGLVLENIQARERGARILAAVATANNAAVSCNSNKAELTVGYTTFYGDMTGVLSIIGDLWKYQVYNLGRYINEKIYQSQVIPEAAFQIRPSAELSEEQTVGNGGDPLYYPYHDYLFNAFTKNITPTKLAQWYQDKTLEEKLGCRIGILDTLFKKQPKAFFDDLEYWYNAYRGLAVAKRLQSPPIIAVSETPFTFTEPQLKPYYSQEYKDIKNTLLQ
ncbi:MAG: NAD(+) synthase [Acidaminococcaceae bacterium]|nr:NAD(+) synthase [Acidaminococcaceae bacterium]